MNVAGVRSHIISRVYLAAGLAATALYFVLPWDSFGQTMVYDAIGASAAVALCQWIFLMQDRLQHGSVAERVVAISYPAMDIVLLSALVFLALSPTSSAVAYRYLGG